MEPLTIVCLVSDQFLPRLIFMHKFPAVTLKRDMSAGVILWEETLRAVCNVFSHWLRPSACYLRKNNENEPKYNYNHFTQARLGHRWESATRNGRWDLIIFPYNSSVSYKSVVMGRHINADLLSYLRSGIHLNSVCFLFVCCCFLVLFCNGYLFEKCLWLIKSA